MLILITGFVAGLFHVLSGPDHLAAVAPLALADRERGWVAGWTWGLGHASGVVAVAVVAIMLRDMLPPVEALSAWGERLVGVALIGIGLWALRRGARIMPARHVHGDFGRAGHGAIADAAVAAGAVAHSGVPHGALPRAIVHDHLHVQAGPRWVRRLGHAHASFYMGILHGIAGSSHFFGVLPALALPSRAAALTYIAAFGVGTVLAMTGFAAAIASVGASLRPGARAQRTMMFAASLLALSVGAWWLIA